MLNISNKNINPSPIQEKFNLDIITELSKRGVHYDELPSHLKHDVLLKYASIMMPDVVRKGFIKPHYISNPDIIVVNRAPTTKDLKFENLSDVKSPSNQVINKIVHELGFNNPYITSITFHATKSFNEWTFPKLQKEFLLKDLEFDTLDTIPQVFLLLGNDAFNVFFNTDSTVRTLMGDIYVSEYKGAKRLFIPIAHPAYLLRENDLYKETVLFAKAIRSVLCKIKNK